MDKSPDAFRTISEVAEHLDTPAHVLRFWESRFPQIRPVKRAGGRRYYRPSDVALLIGIKRLLHDEGMTIRGVQKILREQGVRHVSGASLEAGVDALDDADGNAYLSAMDVDPGPQIASTGAVVVPIKVDAPSYPIARDPAAGLVQAMGHESGHISAPEKLKSDLLFDAPAQGTLLLTPVTEATGGPSVGVGNETDGTAAANSDAALPMRDVTGDIAVPEQFAEVGVDPAAEDLVLLSENAAAEWQESSASQVRDTPEESVDFDDDDFDDGPFATLASRIRGLPAEVVVVPAIRAEMIVLFERLNNLRDVVESAARPGRM